ncbi:glutathione S-transferase N-terminal domain-containing protein [Patulibacter sp. NPDC049589]|uniref:glutathione S-transferase N-terminal domain-containing protein n=1 Tax=Patulibacter sp. NPDC049589 TaxID=3154731 RepID=UPI0034215DE8
MSIPASRGLTYMETQTAPAHADPAATPRPTLYVCHGDDAGPSFHPCRIAHEALREAGVDYETVVAAHGSPIPFLRRGSRADLEAATGGTKLPTLVLADGTVVAHSKAIRAWAARQA